jgi:hypothetical protein
MSVVYEAEVLRLPRTMAMVALASLRTTRIYGPATAAEVAVANPAEGGNQVLSVGHTTARTTGLQAVAGKRTHSPSTVRRWATTVVRMQWTQQARVDRYLLA